MLSSAIEFSLLVWLVFANSTLPEFFDGFLPSALHLHHFRGLYRACGWCKDKWGLSWQITPRVLTEALADPDRAAAKRVFDAMMGMVKIDIGGIEKARRSF